MKDTLHQLFSTPILRSNVAVPFKVLEYIKSQKFHRHDTGFMTDEKLLDDPLLSGIKKLITQKVEEYFYDHCGFSEEVSPVLISSWANLHRKGDYGQDHYHENAAISFCWYLQVTEKSGEFIVYPPIKLFGTSFGFPYRVHNEFNSSNWAFRPENGDLLIFPANLVHGIGELKEDFDRYSVAGNYMMNGPVKCGKVTVECNFK
jgi:hypothetical protein